MNASRRFTLIVVALLPGAAALVHELRYQIPLGGHGDAALAAHGHGYLSALTPLIAFALAAACALALRAIVHGDDDEPVRSWRRLWLAASAALLAVYVGQELLESALVAGHPTGFAALAAGGGWTALPAAFAVGAVLALALRLTLAAAKRVARARARLRAPAGRPVITARRSAITLVPSAGPLARRLAGRAPPVRA